MKKILVMVLVGVIGMSIFTGCGKSEEEKAMDEVASHLRDEAAQDGVDIDKMVEEEAEKYNSELEAGNKTIANENEFKESLKNNEMVPMKEQYEIFLNAIDSATAKNAAEEFNKAYDEYLKAAVGEYLSELGAYQILVKNDVHSKKITDSELQTRVNYLDNCYGKTYENIVFFKDNDKNGEFCILMYNNSSGIMSDLKIVYPDGRTITPNLSTIGHEQPTATFTITKNSVILSDYGWDHGYEFTIDNPEGKTLSNENDYPEQDYYDYKALWENTVEDFNRVME